MAIAQVRVKLKLILFGQIENFSFTKQQQRWNSDLSPPLRHNRPPQSFSVEISPSPSATASISVAHLLSPFAHLLSPPHIFSRVVHLLPSPRRFHNHCRNLIFGIS